tara:strand:- start:49141 stop:50115 length:975 start_codon:yes stop_codon:yes gene_type:complete
MQQWLIEFTHADWQWNKLLATTKLWLQQHKPIQLETIDWQSVDELRLTERLRDSRKVLEDNVIQLIQLPGQRYLMRWALQEEDFAAASWQQLWRDWSVLYQQPQTKLRQAQGDVKLASYLTSIAPAPKFKQPINVGSQMYVEHEYGKLDWQQYRNLQQQAETEQVPLSLLLLALIMDLLQSQVQSAWHRVNVTLLNRLPLFPYLNDKAAFATSTTVLPLNVAAENNVLARAKGLAEQLQQVNLQLNVETLPALNTFEREQAEHAAVYFTCAIEQGITATQAAMVEMPNIVFSSQVGLTSNVWIDVWESQGDLHYRWSYNKGLLG